MFSNLSKFLFYQSCTLRIGSTLYDLIIFNLIDVFKVCKVFKFYWSSYFWKFILVFSSRDYL